MNRVALAATDRLNLAIGLGLSCFEQCCSNCLLSGPFGGVPAGPFSHCESASLRVEPDQRLPDVHVPTVGAGAAGVQIGTAYLLCEEASTSAVHRAALTSKTASHTALTNVFSGRPARGIMNRAMRELGPMNNRAPAFPLAAAAVAPLRAEAEKRGRDDFSPLWAGQNVSGCKTVPAAELTRELARGFK